MNLNNGRYYKGATFFLVKKQVHLALYYNGRYWYNNGINKHNRKISTKKFVSNK